MSVRVERVQATATYRLRQQVLRPHQSVGDVGWPEDDDPDSGHFAALDDLGEIIGTASVCREPPPWSPASSGGWRLRGMAVAPDRRGQGIGLAVLAAVTDHVRRHHGRLLWCNARLAAAGFYRRAGWRARGQPWDEPDLGPHLVMFRAIPATPGQPQCHRWSQ